MRGQVIGRAGTAVILTLLTVGCGTKAKQRIGMLEETNRNIAARLNATQAELDAANRDRTRLDARLVAAMGEVDNLNMKLADASAAQEAAPGWANVPGGAMTVVEGTVLFVEGEAKLRESARRTLDSVVSALQHQYAGRDVLVIGHTDDKPIKKSGWTDNLQLSTERAAAVARYLVSQGVPGTRVIAAGCGEYRPRAAGTSEASRRANRRVEILAVDPLASSSPP